MGMSPVNAKTVASMGSVGWGFYVYCVCMCVWEGGQEFERPYRACSVHWAGE